MQTRQAQVLIFIIFFVLLTGVLAGGLLQIWETQVQVPSLQEHSLRALYLAEAGIERGKAEVLYGYWAPGTYNIANQMDLDLAGDNYQFLYDITITNSGSTTRAIIGIGRVLDLSGAERARREIQVNIDGIQDTDSDGDDDNPPNNLIVNWSWQEQ